MTPEAGTTTTAVAERLGRPVEAVHAAASRLEEGGLVKVTGDSLTLTPAGRLVAGDVLGSWPRAVLGTTATTIDLSGIARVIGSVWPAEDARHLAEKEAEQEARLAADADRDHVVQQLSDAFAQGRLTSSELEDRTGRALSARTYGELDDVLQGLGGLQHSVMNHPVRKTFFWVLAVLASPFVLLGGMLFAFGTDAGDHLGGLVFLVLLLPGLFKLRRWAWPRA
jgi:hypothetical protein